MKCTFLLFSYLLSSHIVVEEIEFENERTAKIIRAGWPQGFAKGTQFPFFNLLPLSGWILLYIHYNFHCASHITSRVWHCTAEFSNFCSIRSFNITENTTKVKLESWRSSKVIRVWSQNSKQCAAVQVLMELPVLLQTAGTWNFGLIQLLNVIDPRFLYHHHVCVVS